MGGHTLGHMSTTYTVTGMTCGHCVASVKEEVGEVPGVTGVEVDLPTGRVEISGSGDDALIRKAIEEAGYAVA
jgi:copper chaperone